MPIKKSAMKELRKTKKRTARNARLISTTKALTKKMEKLLAEDKKAEAQELAKKIQSKLDKAAKKHVIKKNAAARKKARLFKKLQAHS